MIFRKKKKKATCAASQHVYTFDYAPLKVVFTCATCGHSFEVDSK